MARSGGVPGCWFRDWIARSPGSSSSSPRTRSINESKRRGPCSLPVRLLASNWRRRDRTPTSKSSAGPRSSFSGLARHGNELRCVFSRLLYQAEAWATDSLSVADASASGQVSVAKLHGETEALGPEVGPIKEGPREGRAVEGGLAKGPVDRVHRVVDDQVHLAARPDHPTPVQEVVADGGSQPAGHLVAELHFDFRNHGEFIPSAAANVARPGELSDWHADNRPDVGKQRRVAQHLDRFVIGAQGNLAAA